jgi:site-specific recombinase XerD
MNNVTGRLEKEQEFYNKMDKKLNDLPAIFREYYTSMRASRKSYTTIGVYINNILHFAHFVCGDEIPEKFYVEIKPSDVENYIISLETRQTKDGYKRMGDDILQTRWTTLNTFFEWLVKRSYVANNPISAVDRPKNNTEHKVTYLNKIEINRLFKSIDKNPNKVLALRDRTIISLALATALRVSALVNINIEDIDFENGVIHVIEKRQKVRGVRIGENIKDQLRAWINVRNEIYKDVEGSALFLSQKQGRISVDAVSEMLEKYCDIAGIKRITPHKLRSSAACALAKAGLPVKAIASQLGHSNTNVTMRYIDVFEEDSAKANGILDNLF